MALLNEILEWSIENLSKWQRDALRRLLLKQTLDTSDLNDLYAMLKSHRGLPDPMMREPVPLAPEHLPALPVGTKGIVIKELRDLKYVNRIPTGQKLVFAATGMTVIYGGNGSGKSGYSRVLKRACRARDASENVHPDAFDPKADIQIPEATFQVEIGGQTKDLPWKRNAVPPEELSGIAVFDTRCGRAYLDSEQDVAYIPYGLDVLENLAQKVIPALGDKLSLEMASISTDTSSFSDLIGTTAVGRAIAALSSDSDPQALIQLATLVEAERTRLSELDASLAESDPKGKAAANRLIGQRIREITAAIDKALAVVDPPAIDAAKSVYLAAEEARKVAEVAAAELRAGEELLPGTGGQLWKTLFEAARKFANTHAYPEQTFPPPGDQGRCLLCQQSLDAAASSRMKRFDDFVKKEAMATADQKRQELDRVRGALKLASVSFGLGPAFIAELKQINPALLEAIVRFEKHLQARKDWLESTLATGVWNVVPELSDDPRIQLKPLASMYESEAQKLEAAGDEKQRKDLEGERSDLRSRMKLSGRIKPVVELVDRLRTRAILVKCKDDLSTKAISHKAKALASQAVTQALKTALEEEFKALGVEHIKTKLTSRAEAGKTKHKLLLDIPVKKPLEEILSEGEQRSIALGSFLAELHLAGHPGPIIFDDPVSSLDHFRRMNVALRLVREAKRRQVIVLTHDTVFLSELQEGLTQEKVDHLMYYLECVRDVPGFVREGLPWEHKNYRDRIDKLEKAQREIARSWPVQPAEEDRDKMRELYSKLRATLERIIEDVVFNNVVKRYRDWIKVDSLKNVIGFSEAEYLELSRLHKACCDVVPAHDPASAKNAAVPSPVELEKVIADLRKAAEAIGKRGRDAAASVT